MQSHLLTASYTISLAGVPYSPAFDDVYHSRDGAFGQARHVFLGGNGLPQRWQGLPRPSRRSLSSRMAVPSAP